MPTPHPDEETRDEWMARCVPTVLDDGTAESGEQAVAICSQMWRDAMEDEREDMNRAYSLINIKAIDEDQRIIEGIATTPTPDHYEDIVEPMGMEFSLPMPLLNQHNAKEPLGHVIWAKPAKEGIPIRAQIARSPVGPNGEFILKYIEEAWAQIKLRLVAGLSIGFKDKESELIKGTNGIRFTKTRWLELSAVTIPANMEANIVSVKSAAALARGVRFGKTTTPSGDPAGQRTGRKNMTLAEQIKGHEATIAANEARINALIERTQLETRTFDDDEQTEHDRLDAENKKIAAFISTLKRREADLASKATVVSNNVVTPEAGAAARGGSSSIQVTSMVPKGIGFARAMMALGSCGGRRYEAAAIAKQTWPDMGDALEVIIKTEVIPGTTSGTTWASPLMQSSQRLVGEFIELMRAASIIGRIPNLRRVPFNVTVPVQTGGGTYGWVGENQAKPVSALSLTTAVLRQTKIAGIIPYTKEALRLSDPSIEVTVRNDMIRGYADYRDTQFIDPTVHDSIGVNPPSITDQIVNVVASGLTGAAFTADMSNIIGKMITNNQRISDLVILMSETVALNLASKQTSLGMKLFPDINVGGGSYMGIPIITSQNVGARIILFNPTQILFAEDPGVTIDVSEEASVVMDTAPQSSPVATSLVSFWQRNLIGLRLDQFVTWKRAITSAVEYISSAVYSATT